METIQSRLSTTRGHHHHNQRALLADAVEAHGGGADERGALALGQRVDGVRDALGGLQARLDQRLFVRLVPRVGDGRAREIHHPGAPLDCVVPLDRAGHGVPGVELSARQRRGGHRKPRGDGVARQDAHLVAVRQKLLHQSLPHEAGGAGDRHHHLLFRSRGGLRLGGGGAAAHRAVERARGGRGAAREARGAAGAQRRGRRLDVSGDHYRVARWKLPRSMSNVASASAKR